MPSLCAVQYADLCLSPTLGYLPSALSLMILNQAQAIAVNLRINYFKKRIMLACGAQRENTMLSA